LLAFAVRRNLAAPAGPPHAVFDQVVNIGRLDLYQNSECRFSIANGGGEPLVIREAKPGCHCQGVFWETPDGVRSGVRDVVINPGQAVTFGLVFVAGGQLNQQHSIPIDLVTNDPSAPNPRITVVYTATARLYCVPQSLVFGNLLPSQTATTSVDLFADGREEKVAWDRLTCEPAECFSVRFVATPPAAGDTLGGSIASRVGTLHVTLRTPDTPQPIAESLILKSDGKEVFRRPVSARCVPEFELSPETVVLPRRSSTGPEYTTNVICRSTTGREFYLRVSPQSPPGLDIRVERGGPSVIHTLTVTYTTGRPSGRGSSASAELIASYPDGPAVTLRLDVRIDPDVGE
jgi:hypothetical protein